MTGKCAIASRACQRPVSFSPADWPLPRDNTDPAPATPRSRSATPCRIAARLRATAPSARREAAYFAMINEQGGINGRKINFISRDDGYSPPKTVEQVRKLVEEDQVLFMFQTLGTPPNIAIRGYLNENKVPQLFVATGADKWNDPKHYPWTMGWQPSYGTEARIYGRYILENLPDAKIAVLYQNDDYGKDYLNGPARRARRQSRQDDRRHAVLRDHRSDRQFANRGAAGSGAERSADGGHSQIRRPGDPQGLRYRLEADAFPQLGLEFGRNGDEDRGPRERRRHHLGGLRQGSHRSAMAGHARNTRNGWRG